MLDMRRREFITLIGGARLAWPLGARAQQDGSIPRIGILWPGASLPAPPRMEAFRQGLRDLGFIDGQNVIIELRYAQGGVMSPYPSLRHDLACTTTLGSVVNSSTGTSSLRAALSRSTRRTCAPNMRSGRFRR